jgi:light-regulated signal transduction histidine kinase (bacteriophytochrome)
MPQYQSAIIKSGCHKKNLRSLKKSNQTLKDFVSIASHHLKAPQRKINSLTHVPKNLNLPPYKFPENIKIVSLPKIEANTSQMRQLFQNLISNAIKFQKKEMPF